MKVTKLLTTGIALGALAALSTSAQAQVVFSDNFDADAIGIPTGSLINWNIAPLTNVDVIGSGSAYDFYPGNGHYIDMAGSVNGMITNKVGITAAVPTQYKISFLLGKNGTAAESMDVIYGGVPVATITDSMAYPAFVPVSFLVVVPVGTHFLTFNHNSAVNDGQGYVIDNVVVALAAPEPGTLALLGVGGAAFGAFLRRRKK